MAFAYTATCASIVLGYGRLSVYLEGYGFCISQQSRFDFLAAEKDSDVGLSADSLSIPVVDTVSPLSLSNESVSQL